MFRWLIAIAAALLCGAELLILDKFQVSGTLRSVIEFVSFTIIIYLSVYFYRRYAEKK